MTRGLRRSVRRLIGALVLAVPVSVAIATVGRHETLAARSAEAEANDLATRAAEQPALVQRIAVLSGQLAPGAGRAETTGTRAALIAARGRLLRNHAILSGIARREPPMRGVPASLATIYAAGPHHLSRRIAAFAERTERIVDRPRAGTGREDSGAVVQMATGDLSDALNASRDAHARAAAMARERTDDVALTTLAATLAGLVGYGCIVIGPAVAQVIRDIERVDSARRNLQAVERLDAATGLPNRRFLVEHLSRVLADAGRGGNGIGVIHLDLGGAAAVGRLLGDEAASDVLAAAGQRIRAAVEDGAFVARLGDTAFAVVSRTADDRDDLASFADRLVELAQRPIPWRGNDCRLGAVAGAAIVPPGQTVSAEHLLRLAAIALYDTRGGPGGSVTVHAPEPSDAAHRLATVR